MLSLWRLVMASICGVALASILGFVPQRVAWAHSRVSGANVRLTILHNNDSESQMVSADSEKMEFGGVARFAKLIRSLKREAGRDGGAVILLSSGDNFQPGPQFNISLQNRKRLFESIAARRSKYDAMAFGNHDFDLGPNVLATFIKGIRKKRTRFVNSNLDFRAEPSLQALVKKGIIVPRLVIQRRGIRIGLVGSMTPRLRFISNPGKVEAPEDVVARTQGEIDRLRSTGINIIVLLSDMLSLENDLKLAESLKGVDILIAGGERRLLSNPGVPLLPGDEQEVFGPYPLKATDKDGNLVLVVSTPGDYRYVGRLTVEFDENGKIVAVDPDKSGPVRVIGNGNPDSVKPDRRLERKVVRPMTLAMSSLTSEIVGTSEVFLDGRRNEVRSRETNAGNLVADALLNQARALAEKFNVALPQIAILNGGGLVAARAIPPGTISRLDTSRMLRFPNSISVVPEIAPTNLKEILETSISRVEFHDGRFPQIAGFKLTWNPAGTPQILGADGDVITAGTRVREILLNDGRKVVENGQVLSGAPSVNIATLDFLAYVIYHEFAHKLDMLDGAADGTPPLRDRGEYRDWVLTCSREYLRLKNDTQKGRKSLLDAYGATSEAEFFAVATEQFFDQPRLMLEHAPDLYRVLKEYYRQDPAERVSRNNC